MDGSHGSSNSPPPFLTKTYEMVDDPATNLIVSWGPSNNSFIVWNLTEFCRDLLPKYFKHNNFSSFVRQLNTYGFKKIDPDQWEFANEEFIRGQRHLLKNIHRRKPIHSHSQHPQSGTLTETEKQGLEEEMEKLKLDKSKLIAELQRRAQEQHDVDMGMQTLEDRLRGMEHRQKQMTAFLAHIIQKPVLITDLINQSELQTKRRRLPKPDYLYDESDKEDDDAPMALQLREEMDSQPVQAINMEPFEKMELSINSWENFLRDVSHASGEEMCHGTLELEPSTVWQDVNLQLQETSPITAPYLAKDLNSSPEVAESTNDIETSIPYMGKASVLDINAKPSGAEAPSSDERVNMGFNMQTGANDLFWEQFLTETPGSTDAQEVQSERRDTEVKKIETKVDDHSAFWLKKKSVDHITKQMGNLNPAEKATNVD